MKYFTPAWHNGDMTDEQSDAVSAAYIKHRAALLPKMPSALGELATNVSIHDGLIELAAFDRAKQYLRLEFLVGDLQQGYASIHLCYSNVSIDPAVLKEIATDSESEVLYDEIDVDAKGRFEHRILFWPYRELVVSFRSLELVRVARVDRKRIDVPCRYLQR